MEEVTQDNKKELRINLDSNEVKNYFQTQNVKIKEEVVSDDEPTDNLQPISQVYSQEYQIKSEVDSSTLTVERHEDKDEGSIESFTCSLCKKTIMRLWNFKRHLVKIHHLSKEQISEHVPVTNKNTTVKHVSGSEIIIFKCQICSEKFTTYDLLKQHLSEHHILTSPGDVLKSHVLKFYECKYCHRQFKHPSLLYHHEGSHTLPFKCDICGKRFSQKIHLKTHILIHSEPQTPCPHCDSKFRQIHHLKSHIERKHCKGVHKCNQCEKKFNCRTNLLKHIKCIHSNTHQSSSKCDECGKCFKYKHNLKRHIRHMHLTMSKDFICSYCGKNFKAAQYLKCHIKTQHNSKLSSDYSETKAVAPALNELQPNSDKTDAHNSKLQNIYCKQEIPENDGPEISPEIQPISEVYLPKYHEGNIKIEPNSPSDSTLTGVTVKRVSRGVVGNFTCQMCSEKFRTFDFFKQHLVDRHSLNLGDVLKARVPDFYKCEFCHLQFKYPSGLKEHVGSHTFPFKCDVCEKRFARQTYLTTHKLIHSEPQHPCPHCDLKFRQLGNLNVHIVKQHSGVVHKCDQCEKKFKCRTNLLKHIKLIHNRQSSWKCDICGKDFKRKHSLKYHIIHIHQTMSNCTYCGMKFNANQDLKHHIETQHNIKLSSNNSKTGTLTTDLIKLHPNSDKTDAHNSKFQNINCKQKNQKNDGPEISPEIQPISEVYLQEYHEENIKMEPRSPSDSTLTGVTVKHVSTTSEIGNFTCHICSEKFTTIDFFKQHLSDCHSLNLGDFLKSRVPDFYKCEFCNRQFKTPSGLKEHIGSHTLPFKCNICDKRFARQTLLSTHKLAHYKHSEPQHACPHCNWKFSQLGNLNVHIIRKHKEVHKCDQCERTYYCRTDLLKHIESIHNRQSSWECDKCGKDFKSKYYLTMHIISAHQTKNNCTYCGMKFNANQDLKHHIETQHNVKLSSNNSKSCTITTDLNELQSNSDQTYAHNSKYQNIYCKQENDEPEISPEIQPISEVYLQEYHEGNIKIEPKSPSDSTLTDEVEIANENAVEIKREITTDEMDWSKTEESTENEVITSDYDLSNNKTSTGTQ